MMIKKDGHIREHQRGESIVWKRVNNLAGERTTNNCKQKRRKETAVRAEPWRTQVYF